VVLACAVGIALVGLIEAATARDWFEFSDPRFIIEGRYRANSIFRAPEVFGASMSLAALLTWLLYRRGRLSPPMACVLGALFVMATAASLYRGVWGAFAAASAFVFLLLGPNRRVLRILGRMLAVGTLGLVVVLTAWYLTRGTALYEERLANPENWESRVVVYQTLARGITAHPWLGHGTGTVEEYLARSAYNTTDLTTPHNGYLAIAFENGIPFVGLYLAWFLVVVQRSVRRGSEAAVFAGGMVVTILVTDLTMYFPLSFDFHSLIVVMAVALGSAEQATWIVS
jgi:O-antigen ligase